MNSVATHVPDAVRYVVLIDDPGSFIVDSNENFRVVRPGELQLPRYRALAFGLDPASLCFAVKPHAARHLRRRHPGATVVYFDSDTRLYRHPRELIAAAASATVVLTPHLVDPASNCPTQRETMQSGAYNGGVFAVGSGADTDAFLDWWHAQMADPANVQAAWNHDQGWLNLVPAFFPNTCLMRDFGYNVAFWNLHERPMSIDSAGCIRTGTEPLVFFHFSYFDSSRPNFLAAKFGLTPPNQIVHELLSNYAAELNAAGAAQCAAWGTELSRFRNGRPISALHRRYFRERLWATLPESADPFDPAMNLPAAGLKSLYRADHWLTRAVRRLRGVG